MLFVPYELGILSYKIVTALMMVLIVYFAVLEVGDGVFEVLSTSGDTHLGGDDFDKVRDESACKSVIVYSTLNSSWICWLTRICFIFMLTENSRLACRRLQTK